MKKQILLIILVSAVIAFKAVFAQTNIPRGWMDGGGESPIYPAAVDNGYVPKQVAIGTNTAVSGMEFTVKGTATITNKLAVGTTTVSSASALNVVGSITIATGGLKFSDGSAISTAPLQSAVTSWQTGGTTGTGTLNFSAGVGVTLTPSYSSGAGTITISGTSSASGWTAGGTQTVTALATKFGGVLNTNGNWINGSDTAAGLYMDASGNVGIGTTTAATPLHVIGSITVSGNVDGRDVSTDGTTLDNHVADSSDPHGSALTQTNAAITTGTVTTLYTSNLNATNGTITISTGTVTTLYNTNLTATAGTVTTLYSTTITAAGTISATTYTGDGSQLTGISTTGTNTFTNLQLVATSTAISANNNFQMGMLTSTIKSPKDEVRLVLNCDNPGSTTFTDSSQYNFGSITALGAAIGTSNAYFGSGALSLPGANADALVVGNLTTYKWMHGASDTASFKWTVEGWVKITDFTTRNTFFSTRGNVPAGVDGWEVTIEATTRAMRAYGEGNGAIVNTSSMGTYPNDNNWHHFAIVYDHSLGSNNLKWFIDGVSTGTVTKSGGNGENSSQDQALYFGNNRIAGNGLQGYMDDIVISNTAKYTTNFGTPTSAFYLNNHHTQYNVVHKEAINGTNLINVQTPGTATTLRSFILLNATTTVCGLGTTTAITATSTAYTLWVDGNVRATAFNVASSEEIKDNIKELTIKPSDEEAETAAEAIYKLNNKEAWVDSFGANYEYVGTNSVAHVDAAEMEADYDLYINQAWEKDTNRDVYIENVQKEYEKGFWTLFDTVQPKSWNPKGDTADRKGFVVEEVPDEIKGDDMQSIDPMKVIAYMTVVLQSLKEDAVLQLKALDEFIKTGTFTSQAEIEKRIEILEHK